MEAKLSDDMKMRFGNGHFTQHTEAIERKKWVSNVKYEVILALEKQSKFFFGQATIDFTLKQDGLTADALKHVFLNFTKGDHIWISEDIVLNNCALIDKDQMFYNHRVNFEKVYDQIKKTSPPDSEGNL